MRLTYASALDFTGAAGPVAERLTRSYQLRADGCWEWTGRRNTNGYGHLRVGGLDYLAHRLTYTRDRGSIPDGLTLDHLCRNRWCVNPAHLEPVSSAENIRRGQQARLSAIQREAIRRLHPSMSLREIAHVFGVHHTTVLRVLKGTTWGEREDVA